MPAVNPPAPAQCWSGALPDVAAGRAFCRATARLAIRSLYQELTLYPKPGLVSLVDNGSHDDMNAETFLRSLFSLRHYFVRITAAGMQAAPFWRLQQLGIEAEQRMLAATGGINTHRGAIFCLGLLCAAAGLCRAQSLALTADGIRGALLREWGGALTGHAHAHPGSPDAHGAQVASRHGVGGAREEAACGLPAVFELALPALAGVLLAGRGWHCARIEALFALMAGISDTNIYYRGGSAGAMLVRRAAQRFLAAGGTGHPCWRRRALRYHGLFVRRRLSPGGAADLLAATCLVHALVSDRLSDAAGAPKSDAPAD